jgi:hypothetical protein
VWQTDRSLSGVLGGGEDEASQAPLSREQLVEKTLKKIAEDNAKAELMKEVLIRSPVL